MEAESTEHQSDGTAELAQPAKPPIAVLIPTGILLALRTT
jgi:hypothetical protein